MARDATEKGIGAQEKEPVRSEHLVDVSEESEYLVDTPGRKGGNTRRETLYQQADEEAEDPTWDEIKQQWEEDPKELYGEIVEVVQNLRDLSIIHQELRAQLKKVSKENDQNKAVIAGLTTNQRQRDNSEVRSTVGSEKKSIRLPEPPKFSGKTTAAGTSFENWLVQVKNKLRGNHDHFPNEDLKVIYVSGLLEGDALGLVSSRLDPDNSQYYTDVKELYTHLTELYGDPNRVKNARTEFKLWYMKKGQTFQQFYATFLRLVADGNIPKQDLKEELNDKLGWKLQEAVAVYYNDPAVNVPKFAQHCTTLDQQIRFRAEKQDRQTKRNVRTSKNEDKEAEDGPAKQEVKESRNGNRPPRRDVSTVKCYQCNKLGHFARDCQDKGKIVQIEVGDENSGKA